MDMRKKVIGFKKLGKNKMFGFVVVIILISSFIYASTFLENSQSHFDSGTYNNTLYNSSVGSGAVQLDIPSNNGTYTSKVFSTGSNVSLNNLSWEYQRISCPEGMAYINKLGGYCIDKYEAHALNSDGSIATPPVSAGATDTLIAAGGKAGSAFNQTVWIYIDQTEARIACANAGKHLCTDEEWLGAANVQGQVYYLPSDLAVAPYYCVTGASTRCAQGNSPGSGYACNTGANNTGGISSCVSSEGVYDMTGNVWEWTNETVTSVSPPSGAGWYYLGDDLQWSTSSGVQNKYSGGVYFVDNTGRAVLRGGFWGYGAYAGPFSAFLGLAPTNTLSGVGFRCCSN